MTTCKKISYILTAILVSFSIFMLCGCSSDPTMDPSEETVIEKLKTVSDINDVEAATEDNDPYGFLHKDGGHTSLVFFSSPLVQDDYLTGRTPVENGCNGGGVIEVYKNTSDAERRNAYLTAFDGAAINPGSHKIVGSMIVRTSSKLTASQQNQLESEIIEALSA